jgi:anti-sigma regulatory factor (Ser/Thr protein kinase)
VIYTDGVNEAFNPLSECYGNERLLRDLTAFNRQAPSAVTAGLLQRVRAFAAGAPQSDDIAILTFRFVGPPGRAEPAKHMLALELSATPDEVMRGVERLRTFSRAHQVAEKALFGLALALEECSTNIVHHAYRDNAHEKIRLSFERRADALAIELRDRGPAFDPTSATASLAGDDDDRPAGVWGILLTRHYVDEMRYAREGDENVLQLIKLLPPSKT